MQRESASGNDRKHRCRAWPQGSSRLAVKQSVSQNTVCIVQVRQAVKKETEGATDEAEAVVEEEEGGAERAQRLLKVRACAHTTMSGLQSWL